MTWTQTLSLVCMLKSQIHGLQQWERRLVMQLRKNGYIYLNIPFL